MGSADTHFYAKKIREFSLRLVHRANASHIGSALSIADVLAVLYFSESLISFDSPNQPNRDRILLSKGHACTALYSALYLKGLYTIDELYTYGRDYSIFMNHASHLVPGVEFSTGALGHGLPVGCGKALSAKVKKEGWHTFVIMSDGELQEGSNWEAFMFASHFQLSNLTVCIDYNNLQSLCSVEETISLNPLKAKLEAFGWHAEELDGHNHDELKKSLASSKFSKKPTALILNTTKGKGVSFMENSVAWHYKSPSDEQLHEALAEILQI